MRQNLLTPDRLTVIGPILCPGYETKGIRRAGAGRFGPRLLALGLALLVPCGLWAQPVLPDQGTNKDGGSLYRSDFVPKGNAVLPLEISISVPDTNNGH